MSSDDFSDNDLSLYQDVQMLKSQMQLLSSQLTYGQSILQEFEVFNKQEKPKLSKNLIQLQKLKQAIVLEIQEDSQKYFQSLNEKLSICQQNHKNLVDDFERFRQISNNNLNQQYMTLTELSQTVKYFEDQNRQQNDKIFIMTQQTSQKAEQKDLDIIASQVERMTPWNNFQALQLKVDSAATSEEVIDIKQKIEQMHSQLSGIVMIENLPEILDQLGIISKPQFQALDRFIKEGLNQINLIVDNTKEKLINDMRLVDGNNKRIEAELHSKPWKAEISNINDQLKVKCDIQVFSQHKESIQPIFNKFERKIYEFECNLDKQAQSLERFDEIILNKSSKDDLLLIQNQMEQLLPYSVFDQKAKKQKLKYSKHQSTLSELRKLILEIQNILKQNFLTADSQQKQKQDNSYIIIQLKSLEEELKSKLDKSDFLNLSQQVSWQNQTNDLNHEIELIQKQLQHVLVVQSELIRDKVQKNKTMLGKSKQYVDLLRNSNNLINWVKKSSRIINTPISSLKQQNSIQNSPMQQLVFEEQRRPKTQSRQRRPRALSSTCEIDRNFTGSRYL